jgi:hypothetical protein
MRLMSRSEDVEEEADYVKRIEALADHQKQHAALIPVQGYRLPAQCLTLSHGVCAAIGWR